MTRKNPSQDIQLGQEDKMIAMMNIQKGQMPQFESVAILCRMQMTKANCNMRRNSPQQIQPRQEDKLILVMNDQKMTES
jgi:hypothetical protein